MDVEKIAAKITALIEEVYADGVKKGRDLEYEEAVEHLVTAMKNRKRTRGGRARPEPVPAPAEPAEPLNQQVEPEISYRVKAALLDFAHEHEDGVYPDAIAGHTGIKVRDVRQALRSMTLTGDARRMARGKYLPNRPLIVQSKLKSREPELPPAAE